MSGYSSLSDEHKSGVWGVVAFALAWIGLRAMDLSTGLTAVGGIAAGIAVFFWVRRRMRSG